jgi:hypothetical protein
MADKIGFTPLANWRPPSMNTRRFSPVLVLIAILYPCGCQGTVTDGGPGGGGEKPKVRVPTFKYDKKNEGG